jgi:hypothetical protein
MERLLLWPLIVVAGAALVFVYYSGFSIALEAPFSLGDEGPSQWAASLLCRGENPYDVFALANHPWRVLIHPPGYYALGSWFIKITGPVLFPMRLISIASFVILLVTCHRIFTLSGASRLGRALGILTLASFWSIWSLSYRGRPEMLSLMIMALAIEQYMVLARKPKDDNLFRLPRLIVIASLCVVAALIRQETAAVVPAISLALIIGRQWRLSLAFMGLFSFLIVGSFWFINEITMGGLSSHTLFALSAPFTWANLREHLVWLGPDWLVLAFSPLLFVSLVVAYVVRFEEREGPYRHRLAALCVMNTLFVISAGVSLYTLGLGFSGVGDFIQVLFATAWMVAVSVDHIKRRYLLALFLAYGASFYVIFNLRQDALAGVDSMQAAKEVIERTPFNHSLMLAEEPSVAIAFDAVPEFVDLNTFVSVWSRDKSKYDYIDSVKERIANQVYGSIVINSQDGCLIKPHRYWDESVVKLIKAKYRPVVELTTEGRKQDFYVPRKLAK